jgi:hypothetical protein
MARPQASGRTRKSRWSDGGVLARTSRFGDEASRGRDPGSLRPACQRRSITDRGVTLWELTPWDYILLCDHEMSMLRHCSRPALIRSAGSICGNSATATSRRVPHRGRPGLGSPSLHGTAAGWDQYRWRPCRVGLRRHGHAEQFQAPRQLLLTVEHVHEWGRYERASSAIRSADPDDPTDAR